MKINNHPSMSKILGAYTKNIQKPVKNSQQQKRDEMSLSETAREYQVAMKAYKDLPETREKKIQEIREKLENGNYHPSMEKIVESMIDQKV